MSFSDDMNRLQVIIDEFETDGLSMEQTLALFEEGVTLIRECRGYLAEAKRKITMLTGEQELPWDAAIAPEERGRIDE